MASREEILAQFNDVTLFEHHQPATAAGGVAAARPESSTAVALSTHASISIKRPSSRNENGLVSSTAGSLSPVVASDALSLADLQRLCGEHKSGSGDSVGLVQLNSAIAMPATPEPVAVKLPRGVSALDGPRDNALAIAKSAEEDATAKWASDRFACRAEAAMETRMLQAPLPSAFSATAVNGRHTAPLHGSSEALALIMSTYASNLSAAPE